jgi:stearoyl-CoA desaturase (delta-9 desaturase)
MQWPGSPVRRRDVALGGVRHPLRKPRMNGPRDGHSPLRPKSALSRTITLLVVVVPFIATAYAITQLWERQVVPIDLGLLAGMYVLTGLGITIGFHRYATHRSFKSRRITEVVLLALGSMAVEGPVLQWVADHWKHHKFSDRPGDPHSPLDGLLHAHLGWFFHTNRGVPEQDAKHLMKDPVARYMSRTFVFWVALGIAIPYAFDGWRGVLWGGLVRIFITHHITWSVNSICHQFGRRMFQTPDQSHNQWIVGILGLGEGWHNNHHAFPESAFHGMTWYQIDVSGYIIRLLEATRLIRDVRRISLERMERKKIA